MVEVRVVRPVEDALAAATMKVSQSHLLLSGIVDSAVLPEVRTSARACLETLAGAVTDLREIAVSLPLRPPE